MSTQDTYPTAFESFYRRSEPERKRQLFATWQLNRRIEVQAPAATRGRTQAEAKR